jgi:hypothetical protein
VGERIERARKAPARSYKPSVPHEAVDECERSYDAAKGNHQADSDRFDATGWMSLVCQHDIPLFFVNIDTLGEQQKYVIALLEHLYSLLPPEATVCNFYDVGCVTDHSIHLVSPPCHRISPIHPSLSMTSSLIQLSRGSCSPPVSCTPMDTNGHVNLSTTPGFILDLALQMGRVLNVSGCGYAN